MGQAASLWRIRLVHSSGEKHLQHHWVDKYPASSSKQERTEVMIRLEEKPSHVLFKLSWHPISYKKRSKLLKIADNTLPNYLASSLIPPSPCFILEQRWTAWHSLHMHVHFLNSKALLILYPLPIIPFSPLPPPQFIHLFHSNSSFYIKLRSQLLQEAFPTHPLYH